MPNNSNTREIDWLRCSLNFVLGIVVGTLVGYFIFQQLVGPYGGRLRVFGIDTDTMFYICVPAGALIGGVYLAYKARYRRQYPWQS